MCGFYGQFNTANLAAEDFKKLLSLSKHRGPDQFGFWESDWVQLGFNRLAILDLTEAGHQPMISPNGKYVVVFNGEIYNHLALRKKLPAYNYRGHSDTETITHALEVWGITKTIEALDGMFAIAMYNTVENKLTLARDFAGIKPLFYGEVKGQIVFSSQYDQLRSHPLFREKAINPQVLKLYLKQHFVPAPFGLHQGLHQVRPGEIVEFTSHGDAKKSIFWEMPNLIGSDLIKDKNEAQRTFTEAFGNAVGDQLVADVPVGAFLSGGVDSPLLCSYAKERKPDIETFSIGSDSKKHDESERAAQFAKALHLKHHLWKLDAKQMLDSWDDATASLHEPLADFSILPTYFVSKMAKKHITVALSGDGGDELFMGYERFWSLGNNIKYQHLPLAIRKGFYGLSKSVLKNGFVNSLITLPSQSKAHESLHSQFSDARLNKVAPDLAKVQLPDEWRVYNYEDTKDFRQLMANMRKAEFYGMMQKTLRKVDLASMQNSLEVRVPFLQKSMIEASLRIDPMLNVMEGSRKQVLKTNLYNRITSMPDDGVKRGFSVSLTSWIRQDLSEIFRSEIAAKAAKFDFLDQRETEKMLEAHLSGQFDLKWPLFTIYSLN